VMIYGSQIEGSYSDDKSKKEYSDAYRKEVSKRGKDIRVSFSISGGSKWVYGSVFIPNGYRPSDYLATLDRVTLTDVIIDSNHKKGVYVMVISNCDYYVIKE
jgi:hypothetical protein